MRQFLESLVAHNSHFRPTSHLKQPSPHLTATSRLTVPKKCDKWVWSEQNPFALRLYTQHVRTFNSIQKFRKDLAPHNQTFLSLLCMRGGGIGVKKNWYVQRGCILGGIGCSERVRDRTWLRFFSQWACNRLKADIILCSVENAWVA